MKKLLAYAIIILFIGMTIPSTGTYVEKSSPVSFNGNTLYVGGDGPGNYTKIQDAIDDASDGDTVFVYDDSSPYHEYVKVKKSINLIGENRDTTVIDGTGWGMAVELSADWVNISGFTIRNGVTGIYIKSNYNTISGNNIHSNTHGGIWLQYSSNNTIFGNNISKDDFNGIPLYRSNNNVITGNNIHLTNNYGLGLLESSNNTIFGNNISDNEGGLGLMDSNNNIIKDNILTSNAGIDLGGSHNNTISGNNISNNFDIALDYSNYNNITKNNIQNNEKFGLLLSNANNNVIESNNFIDNKRSAFFLGKLYNKWEGNYWDKPREYPKPIFGNIGISPILVFVIDSLIPLPSFVFDILLSLSVFFCTHFPSWVNFDWHPAKEPYDI